MAAHFLDRDYEYEVSTCSRTRQRRAAPEGARGRAWARSPATICGIWDTADWHEREESGPGRRPVRGPSQPEADPHARRLRRTPAPSRLSGGRDGRGRTDAVQTETIEPGTEIITVNMGPSHPATHGVLRIVLELDGERVVERRPARRLPAPRDGEDRREPHLPAVHPLHRPAWTTSRRSRTTSASPRGREAAGHRGAAALPGASACSAASWRASARTCSWLGHARARPRRGDGVLPHVHASASGIYDLVEDLTGARLTTSYTRIGGVSRRRRRRSGSTSVREFVDAVPATRRRVRDRC